MRVALIGRTEALLAGGEELLRRGHQVVLVATRPAEFYYRADEADFARLAAKCKAPFFPGAKLNSGSLPGQLAASGAEVVLSVNWPATIKADVLRIPRHGFLNVHFSDLPRYRGNAGPSWCILNNDAVAGICLHRMEPSLDTGPVLLRRHLPLSPNTYVGDLFDWWRESVPAMLADAADLLERGQANFTSQPTDPSLALRSYPRRAEDGRIEWSRPVEEVLRLIRASSHPFPGAFTSLEGERRLWVTRALPHAHPGPFLAVPGQVLFGVDGDPVIACGQGCLRITEARLEGCEAPHDPRRDVLSSLRNRLI